MHDVIYFNELYDIYGKLLTEKQREYFEDYYFNNLTLAEISENYSVTRTAVHNQLKETEQKLEYYETTLNIKKRNDEIKKLIQNLDENTKEEIINLL